MELNSNKEEAKKWLISAYVEYRSLRGKKARSKYLDNLQKRFKYNRKVLIRMLSKAPEKQVRSVGAPSKLKASDIAIIRDIWKRSGYVNAEYLTRSLRRWLRDINRIAQDSVSAAQIRRICSVSYKTIERALARWRVGKKQVQYSWAHEICLREGIELVERLRNVTQPGHICMDTVAHGGNTTAGTFVWSVTWTDVYSGYTLNYAVWNKGYMEMQKAFDYFIENTPFRIKSINVDNGPEFLNYHTIRYWREKMKESNNEIKLTHSRPYMKNDNAHAEQKNRTHVRELFERYRIDEESSVDEMNKIYRLHNMYRNYIVPCRILKERRVRKEGQKYRRIYDETQTPVERLLKHEEVPREKKEEMERQNEVINAYELADMLREKLELFYKERIVKTHFIEDAPE